MTASGADANEALGGARTLEVAQAAGLKNIKSDLREEAKGRGSARWVRTIQGELATTTPFSVSSVETKLHDLPPRPALHHLNLAAGREQPPGLQRPAALMRTAQQRLYEGIETPR